MKTARAGYRIDLTGQRFGCLLVVAFDEERRRLGQNVHWQCVCDCGARTSILRSSLLSGGSRSCGCMRALHFKTHGLHGTREYSAWQAMIARCEQPNYIYFARYGGRGISVCERWRQSAEAFVEDVGKAPSADHSIDRIDNDRNYEPGNARWATRREQDRNKSQNRHVEAFGRIACISDWAQERGLSLGTLRGRLDRGWNAERALTVPPNKKMAVR